MGFGHWYVRRGRIDAPRFWLRSFLPLVVVLFAAAVLDLVLGTAHLGPVTTTRTADVVVTQSSYSPGWIWWAALLLVASPLVSAQVTRLHDRGAPAWWLLLHLVPGFGSIALLVVCLLPGDPGPNAYGLPPGGSPATGPAPA